MPIAVAGLASSRKTPGFFLNVLLGGAPTSAGAVAKKILLLGNKITSDLTAASPSFTVTAGTQANAAPLAVASADDAATYFGRGSELHRMARAVFAQYPDATVHAVAVAESGGARASAVLTFATNASAAFTVRLVLAGKAIDVAVANGDTPQTIATNCANAVLDELDLPVTAQFAIDGAGPAYKLTVTAKHPGPRGNDLAVEAMFVSAAGLETRITTSSTSSGSGTTGIWSGTGASESTIRLSGGTTADDVTAALAALTSAKYDRYVCAHRDATNLALVDGQMDTMAGVTTQKRQQAVCCTADTYANAVTLATGRNKARLQVVWHYNTETPAEEVAAQVAAARLGGDTLAGGVLAGEASSPNANLIGMRLKSVLPQRFAAEQPTATEIENALNNGLTPLEPTTGGATRIVRSITSRSLSGGQPSYSVLDTNNVTVIDHVADDLQADLAATYAGFRLANDNADGSPPRAALVTTPNLIKARIARKLKLYEEDGLLTDVDANMPLLAVALGSVAGRVDAEIPAEPLPVMAVFGGNVRQVA